MACVPPASFPTKRKQEKKKTGKGCVLRSLQRGQRSYFLVGHLQELGVHVSGTLPFLVEQELVVAAVSTNGCRRRETVSKLGPQTETPPFWFVCDGRTISLNSTFARRIGRQADSSLKSRPDWWKNKPQSFLASTLFRNCFTVY